MIKGHPNLLASNVSRFEATSIKIDIELKRCYHRVIVSSRAYE